MTRKKKQKAPEAEYPELEKLEKGEPIRDFLRWLMNTHEPNAILCQYNKAHRHPSDQRYLPMGTSTEKLVMAYLKIDQRKLAEEQARWEAAQEHPNMELSKNVPIVHVEKLPEERRSVELAGKEGSSGTNLPAYLKTLRVGNPRNARQE